MTVSTGLSRVVEEFEGLIVENVCRWSVVGDMLVNFFGFLRRGGRGLRVLAARFHSTKSPEPMERRGMNGGKLLQSMTSQGGWSFKSEPCEQPAL